MRRSLVFLSASIILAIGFSALSEENKSNGGLFVAPNPKDVRENKTAIIQDYRNTMSAYRACKTKNPKKLSACDSEKSKFEIALDLYRSEIGEPKEENAEECESMSDNYDNDFKECRVSYENLSEKCSSKSELGIIDNNTFQAAAPLMSMVSGADAIMDVYGAMSENPQCSLSREDFKQERDSIKDDIKDIDSQISDKTKEMQEAQEKYTEKLNDWADREREILDELNKIPIEKEKNRRKLDDQKVKMKIEAESKYVSVTEQINTLTAEYSAIIQDQKGALYQASDFAMYDTCNGEYEKRAKAAGTVSTANGLSGAYYSGNLKKSDKVNYMANCMKIQRQNAKRVETAFVNKLNAIKNKIESMDRMRGQIEEERKLADKAIADEMKDLEYDAESKATSLRNEYQGLQQKKLQEQALLNQKLQTLSNEISNLKRKASVLNLRMQHYRTRTLPKSSDKSVDELIEKCNGFDTFKEEFTSMCCDGSYKKGKGLCSTFKIREERDPKGSKRVKKAK